MEIAFIPRILKVNFTSFIHLPEDQTGDYFVLRGLSIGEFHEIQQSLIECTPRDKDSVRVKKAKLRAFLQCQILQMKLCVMELFLKGRRIDNPDYTTLDTVVFDTISQHIAAFNNLHEQDKFKLIPQQDGKKLVN